MGRMHKEKIVTNDLELLAGKNINISRLWGITLMLVTLYSLGRALSIVFTYEDPFPNTLPIYGDPGYRTSKLYVTSVNLILVLTYGYFIKVLWITFHRSLTLGEYYMFRAFLLLHIALNMIIILHITIYDVSELDGYYDPRLLGTVVNASYFVSKGSLIPNIISLVIVTLFLLMKLRGVSNESNT